MLLAERVEFEDRQPVSVGSKLSGYEITKIEVYHDEYPDHSELTINYFAGTSMVGKTWNYPAFIIYQVKE